MRNIKRGSLFYADLNPVIGSEQNGIRPVLVIQNKKGNYHSPTVIVAPLSSNLEKADLPTHYKVRAYAGLREESLVLLEQMRTIDRERMFAYIGRLDQEDMEQIDDCIAVCFGLRMNGNRLR